MATAPVANSNVVSANVSLRSLYDSETSFDLSSHIELDLAKFPDALRCRAMDALTQIRDYHPHTIQQHEEGAFDLLALDYYGTERLFWVIMAFNGLPLFTQLRVGMKIRIPEAGQVKQLLTSLTTGGSNLTAGSSQTSFVEI